MRLWGATILTLLIFLSLAAPPPRLLAAALPTDPRYDQVLNDARAAKRLLNDYWSAELPRQFGIEFDPVNRLEYYRSTGSNGCGGNVRKLPHNAFYCPTNGDEHVAFDIDWFVDFIDRFGGNAVTLEILAHEWGHAVQDSWAESQPGVDRWAAPWEELSADCLAGAFMGDSLRRDVLRDYPGAGESIAQKLYDGGSGTWFDPGDHGSPEQRVAAFTLGAHSSASRCRAQYG